MAEPMSSRKPTRVPTNQVIRLREDPTLCCLEQYVAPSGSRPTIPFTFQVIGADVQEDPLERRTDVAAFRTGRLDRAHYERAQESFARPAGGARWAPNVVQRGNKKSAQTFVRVVGTTECRRTVSIFVAYKPWLSVKLPLPREDGDTEGDASTWVGGLLRIDPEQIEVVVERKSPLVGYQMEPDAWARIAVPNTACLRQLSRALKKRGARVLHDELFKMSPLKKAHLDGTFRFGAHLRVIGGTQVALEHQVEAVDVEVHDAEVHIVNADDDDIASRMPPPTPRVTMTYDFEVNNPTLNTASFVDVQLEENRVFMASAIIQTDATTPAVEPSKVEECDHPSAARAIDFTCVDFGAPDDHVHELSASKVADTACDSAAVDVGRFVISIYPLPPSPNYTVIQVDDEVQLFQALRRLQLRCRVSVRMSHNGDGFDALAQRVRLVLLCDPRGAVCWFLDHPAAGSRMHVRLREQVNQPRDQMSTDIVARERRSRGPGGRHWKEETGVWDRPPMSKRNWMRVVAWNMWLLMRDVDPDGSWCQQHGLSDWSAFTRDATVPRNVLVSPNSVTCPPGCQRLLRLVMDTHPACSRLGRMARKAAMHLGCCGMSMPRPLDAEFLDTDVSRPCIFTVSRASGPRLAHYIVPSLLEVDTCRVSRKKFARKPAKLNDLATRLRLPVKLDVSVRQLFEGATNYRNAVRMMSGTPPPDVTAAFVRIADYCAHDSALTAQCGWTLGCIGESLVTAWMARVHPSTYFRSGTSTLCESILTCRAFPTHNIDVRPDGHPPGYDGSYMPEPDVSFGETEKIACVDVNSLYPSVMQDHNLCYSTLVLSAPELQRARQAGMDIMTVQLAGIDFHVVQYVAGHPAMRKGILPSCMEFLIAARKKVKSAMKSTRDPVKSMALDARQQAIKVMANSMYGFTGFSGSAFPAISIAALTTHGGRCVAQTMERCVNTDFPPEVLEQHKGAYARRARVPERFVVLRDRVQAKGGDTDSIFLTTFIGTPEQPGRLVVLRHRLVSRGGLYTELPVEEVEDHDSPPARVAVLRYKNRRMATQRQRQRARDMRKKMVANAKAAGAPLIEWFEAVTEDTIATRVAWAFANEVAEHMVATYFNKRSHLTGGVKFLQIEAEWVMKKMLLLKKKNYAGLAFTDGDALEDDDYKPKQKGMPSIKADTPLVVKTMFAAVVTRLQEGGIDAAAAVLEGACTRIIENKVPVAEYSKTVTLRDPGSMAPSSKTAQTSLYLRMKERSRTGQLLGQAVPALGEGIRMVKVDRAGSTLTDSWETPGYVTALGGRCRVDRAYYLDVIHKKMVYLAIPRLIQMAACYRVRLESHNNTKLAAALGSSSSASEATITNAVRMREFARRTRAPSTKRARRVKLVPFGRRKR